MGNSSHKQQNAANFKWPEIPTPPKVAPSQESLNMEPKEYPLHPQFELSIYTVNKHAYIPMNRTQTEISTEISKIAKEFETALKEYLSSSRKHDAYKIFDPRIKKTFYFKNFISLEFHGLITLGLIIQFIFVNRSINLKLQIKPLNFGNGQSISFGERPYLISKYIDDVILSEYHQGYNSKRGFLTDCDTVELYIDKVHFHCHFKPKTHLLALNLYKALISHLNEYNNTIYSKSCLYYANGPHVCWNWQIFVLYPESIARCICFLMVNVPHKNKDIYFPFHSRTFDFVSNNRFLDHCLRVGWINNPDPIPLYVDFFKDKLKEIIVPIPDKPGTNKISLENIMMINNYWIKNAALLSSEIHSYIYQYVLSDVTPKDIILFWFGNIKHNKQYCIDKLIPLWMESKKEFDDEIRHKFGLIMDEILIHKNDYYKNKWGKDYEGFGLLAYCIVADQFTRNIYRGTKKAFIFDKETQKLCLLGMDNGYFKQYLFNKHPIYCWVYNLVFQHSEDINIVTLAIDNLKWMKSKLHIMDPMYMFIDRDCTVGGAYKHFKMIEKFGRYLQRDWILERETNEEEQDYLNKSGFMKMVTYKK